jgi:hypothetical protein
MDGAYYLRLGVNCGHHHLIYSLQIMSRLVFADPYTDSYCYDLGASKAMVPRLFVVYPFQAPNNLLSAQDLGCIECSHSNGCNLCVMNSCFFCLVMSFFLDMY